MTRSAKFFDTLDDTIDYLRKNLDVFGKKRLVKLVEAGSATSYARWYARTHSSGLYDALVRPMIELCGSMIKLKEEADISVYHAFAVGWREAKYCKFNDATKLLKRGLQTHKDNPRIFMDLANVYMHEAYLLTKEERYDDSEDYVNHATHYLEVAEDLDKNRRYKDELTRISVNSVALSMKNNDPLGEVIISESKN
ncbi:hypothetical protein HN695_05435 [Candidatus Woesearchaeota archaeon]|nr:hypothetical protein [Candidatus Woesearchaeota archaeon]MBT5272180.1 hypothetical protein [Candidatus Woesearchaeota archaeon]MBT6040507.1 hypothetical protein [Candidatus Woesearchaeota archaeon]MBT6336886.1 hypothetical protein [Candidatus Woesearchaeota archaeon]MBT7927756.1 hypothetical protein [Candidatus Woesearchaeota archaeon]